jgi:hypothetical protein
VKADKPDFLFVAYSIYSDVDAAGTKVTTYLALLPDDAAALGYAGRIVRELKEAGGYDDP